MRRLIAGITIECVSGDIAEQSAMAAVAVAADSPVSEGASVGSKGAIRTTNDDPEAPSMPGHAVATASHHSAKPLMIRCSTPVHGRDEPSSSVLATCYRKALYLADRHHAMSIAFAPLAKERHDFPTELAGHVALRTVIEEAPLLEHIKHIRFVIADENELEVYSHALQGLADRKLAGASQA